MTNFGACVGNLVNAPIQFKQMPTERAVYSVFSGSKFYQELFESPWHTFA
jgi:hypothetical protein